MKKSCFILLIILSHFCADGQLPTASFAELLYNENYPLVRIDTLDQKEAHYYLQFIASHPNDTASAQARKLVEEYVQMIDIYSKHKSVSNMKQLERSWIWPLTQQIDSLNFSFIQNLRTNWTNPFLIDFLGRCVRTPYQSRLYANMAMDCSDHYQLEQWNHGCFYLIRNGQFQNEIQDALLRQFDFWTHSNDSSGLMNPNAYWQAISRIPKSQFNVQAWKKVFENSSLLKTEIISSKSLVQVLGKINIPSFNQQLMDWSTNHQVSKEIRLECLLQLQRNAFGDWNQLKKIIEEKDDILGSNAILLCQGRFDLDSIALPLDWENDSFKKAHPEMYWAIYAWRLQSSQYDISGKKTWKIFLHEKDPYQRVKAVPCLTQRNYCIKALESFLISSKANVTDIYYGTELLIDLNNKNNDSTFWTELAFSLWKTNDMGAQALIAAGIKEAKLSQDQKKKWKTIMEKRLTTLKLPAEVETYNEIARALCTLFPEQKSSYPDYQPQPLVNIDQRQWASLQFHQEYEMEVDIHGETHNIHFFVQELDHPITAMHFKSLVQSGFYDNKFIHRYVPNFVSQGGCPRGDGMGSLDNVIPSEFTEDTFGLGRIGWASAGPHTESCQIFFMTSDAPHLDGRYTNMGAVYKGEEWLSKMTIGTKINWIKLIP